jgi:hypothetical protein
MRSPENDASAAAGRLGPREQPASIAIPAKARIKFNGLRDLTGGMDLSGAVRAEKMAVRMHIIPRRKK